MPQTLRRTASLFPPTSTGSLSPSPMSSPNPSRSLGFTPTPSLPNLSPSRTPHTILHNTTPTTSAPRDVSPAQLQSHLYTAFLEQMTPDVSLRIKGSWHATYHLHRVILIQAGFFKSLFTSGYKESRPSATSYYHAPHIVDVVFDDPNITRSAFEICIARLYGGGPTLYVPPQLIPSPSHPLTHAEPFASSPLSSLATSCPSTHHPTSPRFLLSLLATAVYLSIPSLASQALGSILSTIGPRTVVRYLDFALGKGIGDTEEDEPVAAVGLEKIAQQIDEDKSALSSPVSIPHDISISSSESEIKKEDTSDTFPDSHSNELPQAGPSYYYGGISDKIGEAISCWLTRWGADMLRHEESTEMSTLHEPAVSRNANARKRASTMPTHSASSAHSASHRTVEIGDEHPDIPVIWRRGGLNATWIRLVLSSDTLFVRGEKERYDMARSVVELRRKVSIDPDEEKEWILLFDQGIYYSNMGLDDLMSIMEDISPTTGKPFVSASILQSAHWDQSVLQHHITFRPPGSSSPPSHNHHSHSHARGSELGITVSTQDIQNPYAEPTNKVLIERGSKDKPFFPVPTDSSTRVGDSAGLDGATMDQLFDLVSPTTTVVSSSSPNSFGLEQHAFAGPVCAREDPEGKVRWVPFPPLRFGVEFWDVDALKEKSRLHSHTVWYAGSLWNVYVQVVRKKGVQLGVYLHRQSSVDPIPPSSAPLPLTGFGVPLRQSFTFHAENSPLISRSPTPHSRPSSSPSSPPRPSSLPNSYSTADVHSTTSTSGIIPSTAPPVMPLQPYRDPRPSVSAYFTIACASATGSSLTRFTSSPDNFSVSQSWGWKSSSLRTEEYLELSEDGSPKALSAAGREVSLRATIVLGVI